MFVVVVRVEILEEVGVSCGVGIVGIVTDISAISDEILKQVGLLRLGPRIEVVVPADLSLVRQYEGRQGGGLGFRPFLTC